MKLITEYLEHAFTFERMSADETNPELKAKFEQQAKAYRLLVAERAARYGMPPPSEPEAPSFIVQQATPETCPGGCGRLLDELTLPECW
jgi:hypothetical protein